MLRFQELGKKQLNKELDALKERHSDITIIDWYSVANNNQNYFEPDKVHLNSEGVELWYH